jgi:hypothetical protein
MNTSEISLTGAAAVGSMRVLDGGKYPDSYYVQYDPFEGDRDVDVKMRTVRIVKARTEHKCWMGMCPPEKPHTIKVGERCRYERALIDSEKWCGYYICLPCIDAWLKDVGVEPPNADISHRRAEVNKCN